MTTTGTTASHERRLAEALVEYHRLHRDEIPHYDELAEYVISQLERMGILMLSGFCTDEPIWTRNAVLVVAERGDDSFTLDLHARLYNGDDDATVVWTTNPDDLDRIMVLPDGWEITDVRPTLGARVRRLLRRSR